LTIRRFNVRHRDQTKAKAPLDFASIEPLAQAAFGNRNETRRLILVFYAFAREIAPFKRRLREHSPLAIEGLQGFRAQLGGTSFTVIGHGIGHKHASDAARRAFDQISGAELVIGTGVVGALSSGLKPGDLILADRVLALHPDAGLAEQVAAADEERVRDVGRSLTMAGIEYSTGALLTSHRVLATGAEKRRAKESTGAIAVDMETATLAAEAAVRGIPFLALRTVLDEVDEEVFGAEIADEDGAVRPAAAVSYLLRNPGAMLKVPRMVRNLSRATAAIADALTAIAYAGKLPDSASRARARTAERKRRR
jgi:adenosylhomocysteine nucleosidase